MGITDDRGRAMRAGEETLGSGRAAMVIIEVVRPGMAAHTLAPCYVRTGVGWLGRRAGMVVRLGWAACPTLAVPALVSVCFVQSRRSQHATTREEARWLLEL